MWPAIGHGEETGDGRGEDGSSHLEKCFGLTTGRDVWPEESNKVGAEVIERGQKREAVDGREEGSGTR